jgi:hypothetical protein
MPVLRTSIDIGSGCFMVWEETRRHFTKVMLYSVHFSTSCNCISLISTIWLWWSVSIICQTLHYDFLLTALISYLTKRSIFTHTHHVLRLIIMILLYHLNLFSLPAYKLYRQIQHHIIATMQSQPINYL